MIDFSKYEDLKKSGALQIQKIGSQAVAFIRKFNAQTGAEQLPDMGPVDVKVLLNQREQQAKILDGIDKLLADLNELGVDTAPKAE